MPVLDRFRLDGRRLFITGGSRGLGREMALAIAEAGADVVLVGRDADSLARTAATSAASAARPGLSRQTPARPQAASKPAAPRWPRPIDILINNIGGRRVNVPSRTNRSNSGSRCWT